MTEPTELTPIGRELANRKPSELTPEELAQAYRAGLEPDPDGADRLVGRDPRTMTPDELRALGHRPLSDAELAALVARMPWRRPGQA